MPPGALRKLIAYHNHHTHWTERVEHLLLQLVTYTVNANVTGPAIPMDKFRPPLTRAGAGDGTGAGELAQAESAAASYAGVTKRGEHQQD